MGSVTVLDLATEVLSLYGSYAAGETIDSADVQSLIFTLNGILDGITAETLSLFSDTVLAGFTLTPGKQVYSFGAGASDFPLAGITRQIVGIGDIANNIERPLKLLTDEEWEAIRLKTFSSSVVTAAWIRNVFPLLSITFWPVPTVADALRFYYREPVSTVSASSDVLILPAGYQEWLTFELAIKAAPKFGANLPAWLGEAWREAKTRVKESNYSGAVSRLDSALTGGRGRAGAPSLSFYTGE